MYGRWILMMMIYPWSTSLIIAWHHSLCDLICFQSFVYSPTSFFMIQCQYLSEINIYRMWMKIRRTKQQLLAVFSRLSISYGQLVGGINMCIIMSPDSYHYYNWLLSDGQITCDKQEERSTENISSIFLKYYVNIWNFEICFKVDKSYHPLLSTKYWIIE